MNKKRSNSIKRESYHKKATVSLSSWDLDKFINLERNDKSLHYKNDTEKFVYLKTMIKKKGMGNE